MQSHPTLSVPVKSCRIWRGFSFYYYFTGNTQGRASSGSMA